MNSLYLELTSVKNVKAAVASGKNAVGFTIFHIIKNLKFKKF